jgi:hypothetical protein
MAIRTCAASIPTVSVPAEREESLAAPVLVLEVVGAVEHEPPVLLDQTATHLCLTWSTNPSPGEVVVRRSALGWNLRAYGVDCRLNGIPVEDVWLYDGDRITVAKTEYRVRPATTEELLGHLPDASIERQSRLIERMVAVASRERDLAEWEECLSACEDDLQVRRMRTEHADSPADVTPPAFVDSAFLAELQELRTDRSTFDADRQRMQAWLETLQDERAVLERERTRLDADRALLADRAPRATPEAAPRSLSATIAEAISTERPPQSATVGIREASADGIFPEDESGPIGMEWHRPRRDLEASRLRMNSLRQIANHSARQTLARHFWKQQRSAVVLKAALVAMSFSLASVLYWHHGAMETSISALVWGAAAIGLITLSGLVHTWSEVNRLNARFSPSTADDTPEMVQASSATLMPQA